MPEEEQDSESGGDVMNQLMNLSEILASSLLFNML